MYNFKRLEDLTFTDDFMFSQVMKDKEICKEVVETILGIKVGRIEFLTSQYEIEIDPEAKTIAMDVYLRDEKKIINVEMQTGHRLELPKRSRYYQAASDIDNTPPSGLYSEMRDNYVIFICTFDPFLQGKAFYKFENICLNKDKPLRLNDGTYKIFLNTAAEDLTLLDPELKLFYDYIRRGTADSTLTEKINSSITELKEDRETRRKYMTYTTRIAEAKSEAREEGRKEGIKYGISIGRNEGISIGLSQGAHQKAVETAKNLLSIGLSQKQIASVTGLSPEEIEKL
ncbi:MAG: Rpn family recombination-promoting nuclease/putative transposase [Spirochaetales bacterium]|nr:Rpn family recombination-promoting nuclease/putative transposase [Spirochaetales bacterium]